MQFRCNTTKDCVNKATHSVCQFLALLQELVPIRGTKSGHLRTGDLQNCLHSGVGPLMFLLIGSERSAVTIADI